MLHEAFCDRIVTEHAAPGDGPTGLPWVEQVALPPFSTLQLMRVPVFDPPITLQLAGPEIAPCEPFGPVEQYAIAPAVEQLGLLRLVPIVFVTEHWP